MCLPVHRKPENILKNWLCTNFSWCPKKSELHPLLFLPCQSKSHFPNVDRHFQRLLYHRREILTSCPPREEGNLFTESLKTSLKTGFAQISLGAPKNLSCTPFSFFLVRARVIFRMLIGIFKGYSITDEKFLQVALPPGGGGATCKGGG